MRYLKVARHWFWMVPIALGFAFIASGAYMISEGRSAHDEVRDALVRENITTPEDAVIPGVLVDSADEAKAQAAVIEKHYLKATDGKTYAELDREDPARQTALTAANLRTSLNLAVMGFKVSELVVGLGAFMIVMGATNILFLAPAVYWAAEIANKEARAAARRLARVGEAEPFTT